MKVCLQLQAQKNVCQLEGGLELGHPKQGAPTLGRMPATHKAYVLVAQEGAEKSTAPQTVTPTPRMGITQGTDKLWRFVATSF
jgi:hypothetical protein